MLSSGPKEFLPIVLWGRGFAISCLLASLIASPWLDRLTNTLLFLTTFLFAVVYRYSERYLHGDPGQSRFSILLCVTGAFVFAIILSQNLLYFAIAWCGTSLSLHQLLTFYGHRPAALLAARKKFLISRLGDVCLLATLLAVFHAFGTWQFSNIFQTAEHIRNSHYAVLPSSISLACLLLVFAACLKSAQFPFHTWLPDTMEVPTPVSALMHAGIINAGGILVIRLSPLLSLSKASMTTLACVGAFTALFASLVMLTQASVKRCLAFSTVAQMGFMMLECGLGAFQLALLHLVAHSLYKAYAFLSAGSSVSLKVKQTPKTAQPLKLLVAAVLAILIAFALPLHQFVLAGVLMLGLMQMISIAGDWKILPVACAFAAAYFLLEQTAGFLVPVGQPETYSPWLVAALFVGFAAITLVSFRLEWLSQTSLGQLIYVQARNGFYFNTLANRLVTRVWPIKLSQESL